MILFHYYYWFILYVFIYQTLEYYNQNNRYNRSKKFIKEMKSFLESFLKLNFQNDFIVSPESQQFVRIDNF